MSPIRDIAIATRDGTVLRGLHYAPDATPAAAIVVLTPYGANRHHNEGTYFSARGFHFVTLDCRGRGDSDGHFRPFVNDGEDGHDAVEALASLPWCTGDVVTWGLSYCGFVQWATAATAPPHLRAIAPVAPVHPGIDFPMTRNIPTPFMLRWLVATGGRRHNEELAGDEGFWDAAVGAHAAAGRPFADLDLATIGRVEPTFREWLEHPALDEYWRSFVLDDAAYENITIPVLSITGHYDGDQLGALTYHRRHRSTASANDRHHLVIGPWDHGGTRTPTQNIGGVEFGAASMIDVRSLHADWYEWVLGCGAKPSFLRADVVYYHEGSDEWRGFNRVPDGPGGVLRWYLCSPAELGETAVNPESASTLYSDPASAAGTPRATPPAPHRFDEAPQSGPLETSLLRFTGSVLHSDTDVTGRAHARIWVVSDLPDFDLLCGLYEVADDLSATVLLGESTVRARFRNSLEEEMPWPRRTPTELDFEFPFLSRRVRSGRRIVLIVRPPHRFWQVNLQGGGSTSAEDPNGSVAGSITVLHGGAYDSALEIPLA